MLATPTIIEKYKRHLDLINLSHLAGILPAKSMEVKSQILSPNWLCKISVKVERVSRIQVYMIFLIYGVKAIK